MSSHNKNKYRGGQLLLGVLVSIALIAVVAVISTQFLFTGQRSQEIAGERGVASDLISESFEAVESVATESWHDIYNLGKGSSTTHYPTRSSGKWTTAVGTTTVVVNNETYTQYFYVENVCRNSSDDITGVTDSGGTDTTCNENGGSHDPSTQKITATVEWASGAESISTEMFISRWRNQVCSQTSWDATGTGTSTCPTTDYSSSNNLSTGDTLQIQ